MITIKTLIEERGDKCRDCVHCSSELNEGVETRECLATERRGICNPAYDFKLEIENYLSSAVNTNNFTTLVECYGMYDDMFDLTAKIALSEANVQEARMSFIFVLAKHVMHVGWIDLSKS